jgi:hypothetical protein
VLEVVEVEHIFGCMLQFLYFCKQFGMKLLILHIFGLQVFDNHMDLLVLEEVVVVNISYYMLRFQHFCKQFGMKLLILHIFGLQPFGNHMDLLVLVVVQDFLEVVVVGHIFGCMLQFLCFCMQFEMKLLILHIFGLQVFGNHMDLLELEEVVVVEHIS